MDHETDNSTEKISQKLSEPRSHTVHSRATIHARRDVVVVFLIMTGLAQRCQIRQMIRSTLRKWVFVVSVEGNAIASCVWPTLASALCTRPVIAAIHSLPARIPIRRVTTVVCRWIVPLRIDLVRWPCFHRRKSTRSSLATQPPMKILLERRYVSVQVVDVNRSANRACDIQTHMYTLIYESSASDRVIRTVRTGVSDSRTTFSVTLPTRSLSNPVLPRVPITMRSISCSPA